MNENETVAFGSIAVAALRARTTQLEANNCFEASSAWSLDSAQRDVSCLGGQDSDGALAVARVCRVLWGELDPHH
jgi:hypothetical protein